MLPGEYERHSFIVRIWLEETAAESGRVRWRGSITHIPEADRRYLRSLWEIVFFIMPYLEQLGVQFGPVWGVGRWLYRHRTGRRPPGRAGRPDDATG